MSKNRFSIITCSLNREKYIGDLIKSVEEQSFEDYEHIFVDGYSTDKTQEIIRSYALRNPGRVKMYLQKPSGISSAMNFGVNKAEGEIICHLHSDDMFFTEKTLEIVDKVFRDNPGTAWCYGGLNIIDKNGKQIRRADLPEFSYELLKRNNFIPHPSVFITKGVFIKAGGFGDYKCAMDYDLWLRLAKSYTPVRVNEVLSVFRRHEGSVSTKYSVLSCKEGYQIRSKLKRRADIVLRDYINYLIGMYQAKKS